MGLKSIKENFAGIQFEKSNSIDVFKNIYKEYQKFSHFNEENYPFKHINENLQKYINRFILFISKSSDIFLIQENILKLIIFYIKIIK